ncbi:MAG: efflux RND transporter periplasmic adaptor subunit, partial [Alphaproteobacteria bacterium]|nr:efflux RND transporter periplasmic adaptor subunit [Alphaproteobacteria bacterium]
MKKSAIVIVTVIIAIVIGLSFIKKGPSSKKYITHKLSKGDITEMVSASGTINPISNIDVG